MIFNVLSGQENHVISSDDVQCHIGLCKKGRIIIIIKDDFVKSLDQVDHLSPANLKLLPLPQQRFFGL